MTQQIKHASLFSGIGGFDLAAEWMGWDNVFHCEWMEFPRKILEYYWPDADSHVDICNTDFTKYANTIDILTGGFPCQPFSMAGKRKGTKDERYLWGEMLRAVQEIKPTYVIAENVFGITNIDGGLVFEQVCLDLEAEGYEVQSFVIPAAAKNAPHRRDRVWFVAYSILRTDRLQSKGRLDVERSLLEGRKRGKEANGFDINYTNGNATDTLQVRLQQCKNGRKMGDRQEKVCGQRNKLTNGVKANGKISDATDTNGNGLNKCNSNDEINTSKARQYALRDIKQSNGNGNATDTNGANNQTQSQKRILGQENKRRQTRRFINGDTRTQWNDFPTQSPICGGDDGIPTKLDGITFSKWRNESIKGYGNAIVPQVALEIFKVIQKDYQHDNAKKDC